jgi:hypothetical protein
MKKNLIILLTLVVCLFLNSCAIIIGQLKSEEQDIPTLKVTENNYCSETNWKQITLLGRNEKAVSLFHKIINRHATLKHLSFIEKSVLWSLFQMNLRPDMSAPTARLQVVLSTNNDIRFFDFTKKEFPFLEGLNFLLKTYKTKRSLKALAVLLDRYLPKSIPIEEDFATFLKQKGAALRPIKIFKRNFFKADEPLQKGESVSRIPYTRLLKSLKNNFRKKTTPAKYLFNHTEKETEYFCNQDFNLYKNKIYPIQYTRVDSNSFGISSSDGDFFFASSSQHLEKFESLKKTILFSGTPNPLPFAMCFSKNLNYGQRMVFISNRGKDPGQILYGVIKNLNTSSLDLEEVVSLIKGPRKLYLMNPNRMLFESSKAQEKSLEDLLKSSTLPIYHAPNLGEVWAFGHFGKKERFGFIKDSRNPSFLSCR